MLKTTKATATVALVNASAVRVPGIAAGLRLGAVGNFIAGVAIALAWNTVDTIGSDALLEFFDVQQNLFFHFISPSLCFVRVGDSRHQSAASDEAVVVVWFMDRRLVERNGTG